MFERMASEETAQTWQPRSVPPELGAADVHVWHFPLLLPADSAARWLDLLSPAERARAARFAFPHLRERYVAAHAMMRQLLGAYLKLEPESLEFLIAERGKPSLPGNPVYFNLSHTADQGLLAVTRIAEVGVDIECLDRKLDRTGIAGRFFSKAEADELGSLPEALQAEAFCNLWTRKEAWLKATGVGISEGLNKVEFNCRPDEPARLLRIAGGASDEWQVRTFRPLTEHIGSLAIRTERIRLGCFKLIPD